MSINHLAEHENGLLRSACETVGDVATPGDLKQFSVLIKQGKVELFF